MAKNEMNMVQPKLAALAREIAVKISCIDSLKVLRKKNYTNCCVVKNVLSFLLRWQKY